MSLQVWLPLTKDLRQQGLSNTITTNHGTTYQSTSGKLGGCYKTSSSGYLDLGYNGNQINSTSLSFGGWFKFNQSEISSAISGKTYTSSAKAATGNLIGNNSYGGISLQWNSNDIYTSGSFSSMSVQSYLRTSTNGARATSSFTLPFDTWIHIFLTYNKDENILGLWINGELKYTYTQVTFTDAVSRNLVLNYGAIAGGNGPSAYIPFLVNDVRIYDHCLSSMEVKELAKGLVLHYPLNRQGWGQENLLKVNCCSGGNRATFLENGRRVKINWTSNAGDTYWYLGLASGVTLTEGKTYTLSFQCSGLGGNTVSFRWCNLADYNVFLKNGFNAYTFSMPSTSITNPFFDDVNRDTSLSDLELWNFKLEEGSIATPWCPNSSDTLATTMGLNSTTEYDCSGFCNNGTKTGIPIYTSDTSKYAVSTQFTGTQFITANSPTSEGATLALWVKTTSTSNAAIAIDYKSKIGFGFYSGVIIPSCNGNIKTTYATTNYTINQWNHIAVVRNSSSTLQLYINGILQTNTTSTQDYWSGGVIDGLSIAARPNGTSPVSCQVSDVRIYATALSASDVKSLYQNCATIDPDGTIRGQIRS